MARNPDGTYAATHDASPEAVLGAMEPGTAYTTGELARAVGSDIYS